MGERFFLKNKLEAAVPWRLHHQGQDLDKRCLHGPPGGTPMEVSHCALSAGFVSATGFVLGHVFGTRDNPCRAREMLLECLCVHSPHTEASLLCAHHTESDC